MYINEVHELVRVIAQVSASGQATVSNAKAVEDLGIDVVWKLAQLYVVNPADAWEMLDRGEVCDSTFITCVDAAVEDVV